MSSHAQCQLLKVVCSILGFLLIHNAYTQSEDSINQSKRGRPLIAFENAESRQAYIEALRAYGFEPDYEINTAESSRIIYDNGLRLALCIYPKDMRGRYTKPSFSIEITVDNPEDEACGLSETLLNKANMQTAVNISPPPGMARNEFSTLVSARFPNKGLTFRKPDSNEKRKTPLYAKQ